LGDRYTIKPIKIRASYGTAVKLGLISGALDVAPTTAYLLTYFTGRCRGHCVFCAQSILSKSPVDKLSRISWPEFKFKEVLSRLESNPKRFLRICIQSLNYPSFFEDLRGIISELTKVSSSPISVSCQPLNEDQIVELHRTGVERLGIPLDGASSRIFENVKGSQVAGPYRWNEQIKAISKAVNVYGKGKVTTHIIVGLGETDKEVVNLLCKMNDIGVLTSLFPFTPIKGSLLENEQRPSLERYRVLMAINYLINKNELDWDKTTFNNEGLVKKLKVSKLGFRILRSGEPFRTFGCLGCNRPYYNERVSGPIYNYPRSLNAQEIKDAIASINQYIHEL
jgi:biotin synthase